MWFDHSKIGCDGMKRLGSAQYWLQILTFLFYVCSNNAGKYSHRLEYSEDKIEMTFATNYLGIFFYFQLEFVICIISSIQQGF